jgi:hypothetical protein
MVLPFARRRSRSARRPRAQSDKYRKAIGSSAAARWSLLEDDDMLDAGLFYTALIEYMIEGVEGKCCIDINTEEETVWARRRVGRANLTLTLTSTLTLQVLRLYGL